MISREIQDAVLIEKRPRREREREREGGEREEGGRESTALRRKIKKRRRIIFFLCLAFCAQLRVWCHEGEKSNLQFAPVNLIKWVEIRHRTGERRRRWW